MYSVHKLHCSSAGYVETREYVANQTEHLPIGHLFNNFPTYFFISSKEFLLLLCVSLSATSICVPHLPLFLYRVSYEHNILKKVIKAKFFQFMLFKPAPNKTKHPLIEKRYVLVFCVHKIFACIQLQTNFLEVMKEQIMLTKDDILACSIYSLVELIIHLDILANSFNMKLFL